MKTLEEIIDRVELKYDDTYEVEVCDLCEGLGYTFREELTDYHKRDYSTFRDLCKRCEGDGRVVVHTISVEVRKIEEREYIPFKEAEKQGDPFEMYKKGSHQRPKIKIDRRCKWRERDHPELAALTYEKYDKLLDEIEMIAKLKRNT